MYRVRCLNALKWDLASRSTPGYAAAREAYLSRFPQAVDTFALPDFSLFAIRPLSIRFIAGFAQAVTLTPTVFATSLRQTAP